MPCGPSAQIAIPTRRISNPAGPHAKRAASLPCETGRVSAVSLSRQTATSTMTTRMMTLRDRSGPRANYYGQRAPLAEVIYKLTYLLSTDSYIYLFTYLLFHVRPSRGYRSADRTALPPCWGGTAAFQTAQFAWTPGGLAGARGEAIPKGHWGPERLREASPGRPTFRPKLGHDKGYRIEGCQGTQPKKPSTF